MSDGELKAMQTSGRVVESKLEGVTSVSTEAATWIRQTDGKFFVEFDVPTNVLKAFDGVTGKIYGPSSIFGKLGIIEMPTATNIVHTATKLP
jgi:hypothetical protein